MKIRDDANDDLFAANQIRSTMPVLITIYIIGFVAFMCVCGMAGYWILQPIAQAVKGRRRPTRYSMVDFLWLSIMATVSMAPLANSISYEQLPGLTQVVSIVTVMALVVIMVIWWRGVATLSGLGIVDHRRRGVFLIVVLPVSIAVSLVGVPGAMVALWSAFNGSWPELGIWFLVVAMTVLVVSTARRVCLWVLSGATDPRDDLSFQSPAPFSYRGDLAKQSA